MSIIKKVKKFSLLVGFYVLIVATAYAQKRWIPFGNGGPQKAELQVVSCDAQGIIINANIPVMFSQKLHTSWLFWTMVILSKEGHWIKVLWGEKSPWAILSLPTTTFMRRFYHWEIEGLRKKFKTTVTKLSEISPPTNTGIQTYIRTRSSLPSYVLLVGDTDYIPTFNWQTSNGPATDLPYFLKDDADYLPDIFVGRFPVASTSQTEVMVEKILQ